MGEAGSLSCSKPAQPGYIIKNVVIMTSLCSSSASLRHRHGVGVESLKEAFFVTLVRNDHCVSKTHITSGEPACFCGAVLTLWLSRRKMDLKQQDQGALKMDLALVGPKGL